MKLPIPKIARYGVYMRLLNESGSFEERDLLIKGHSCILFKSYRFSGNEYDDRLYPIEIIDALEEQLDTLNKRSTIIYSEEGKVLGTLLDWKNSKR